MIEDKIKQQPRRSNRKKRVWTGALIILLFILIAGIFYLHSPKFKSFVLSKINNFLETRYNLSLSAESFDFNLLRLSADLENIEIRPVSDRQKSLLQRFSAHKFSINIASSTLWGRKIHIQKLSIDSPHLGLNFIQPDKPPVKGATTPKKPLSLRIDSFLLDNGLLAIQDKKLSLSAGIANLKIEVEYGKKERLHAGFFNAGSGDIRLEEKKLSLQELNGEFEFDDETVLIRKFFVQLDPLVLSASGKISNFQQVPRFEIDLSGSIHLNQVKDILQLKQRFDGELGFAASLKGSERSFLLEGNITGQNASVENIPVSVVRAAFKSDAENLDIENLEIETLQGNLQGQVSLSLSGHQESSLELKWKDIALANFEHWESRILPLLSASSSGQVLAKWKALALSDVEATGDIRFTPSMTSSPPNQRKYGLEGQIGFESSKGKIRILPSSIRIKNSKFLFSGNWDGAEEFRSDFQAEVADLAEISGILEHLKWNDAIPVSKGSLALPTQGQLSLKGTAQGTIHSPRLSLVLRARDIVLRELEIPLLDTEIAYNHRGIEVSKLNLELKQGQIQAEGRLSYNLQTKTLGRDSQFKINAQGVNVEPLVSSARIKHAVKGIFSGKAAFSGTVSDPKVQFSASCEKFVFDKETVSLWECQGRFEDQTLELEKIRFNKGTGTLEGNLGFGLSTKEFHLVLAGRDIELSDFESLHGRESRASGTVRFQVEGKGTLEKPVFNFSATMDKAMVADAYLGQIEIKAASDGETATLGIAMPGGRTSIDARLLLQKPYILRGSMKTQALDAWQTLKARVEPLPSPIATEITAQADFSVPVNDWKQSSAQIHFETLALRYKDYSLQNQQPILLKVENQELSWESAQLIGPDTQISVSGTLSLLAEKEEHIALNGSMDLRLLEVFLHGMEIGGTLTLKSSISGAVVKPLLDAQISLKNGSLTPSNIPYSLKGLEIAASIKDNRFELEKFSAGVNGGNISAHGHIDLQTLLAKREEATADSKEQAKNEMFLTWTGLDLKNFVDLLPEKPAADVGGQFEGSLRFLGDFASVEKWNMEGEVSKLELLLSNFKMTNKGNIRLSMNDGIFRMENLALSGGDSFIQAGLTLSLLSTPFLEASLNTSINIAKLTPLFEDIVLDGILTLDLGCRGPLDDLDFSGNGQITKGFFQLRNYPLLATNIDGNLGFSRENAPNFSLSGIFNGGKTDIQGQIFYDFNKFKSVEIQAKADQVQLSSPEGFQGLVNGNLTLSKREQKWILAGRTELTESFFGADIYPGSELIKSLRSQKRAWQSDIPPMLRPVNLDIDVSTTNPFFLDNNLASLEMEGSVRVGGTVYEPRLTGFIRNRQAGEIIFNDRTFDVERAAIDFVDVDSLEGRINLIAHTIVPRVQNEPTDVNVTLTLTGPITDLNFSLTSVPALPEFDIALRLITGHGIERLRTDAANIIGNQLMLYFLNPLASPFTNTLKKFLGAEEVTIQPINIATEADPGARFTFRKGLVSGFDLIYSIDIGNTQNQTWILNYDLSRNFAIQSFAKDDGSYGGSFSHRFYLGGSAQRSGFTPAPPRSQYTIKDISFSDVSSFSREILEGLIRPLKRGAEFSYRDLRRAIDKLSEFYKNKNFLNVVISPSLDYMEQNRVSIDFTIKGNKPASLVFVGDTLSKKFRKQILSEWNGRLPEEMSMAEAEKKIRLHLNSRGHIQAEVTASKNEEEKESFYVIFVHLGPKFRMGEFTLSEESAVSAKSIKKAVSSLPRAPGKGLWALLYDFKRAKQRIASLYENLGYQNASILYPEISPDQDKRTIDIVLPVKQGRRSLIRSIAITGNQAFPVSALLPILQLKKTDPFSPNLLATDTNMLYSFYRARGYRNVAIETRTETDSDSMQIGIIYAITEGELYTISSVAISGNERTPDHVIRRELVFKEGEALNLEDIIASQKNLYDLMAFNSVNIYQLPSEDRTNRVRVVVEVQEIPRFRVDYGLRYNSEEKMGGFGQLDLVNLLGRGRHGLLFYKQNKLEKELRFSLMDPYLFGQKFNTLYSLFYLEETDPISKNETYGISVQQELKMPLDSKLSYLFRYNRIHSYLFNFIGPFPNDIIYSLPEFQVFWLRDTRDNMINAKNGSFLSLSLKYSPSFLKTDLTYISFFGQYSLFLPIRPFFVWASNYRIGLADAFDQVLAPSNRRFFAGGANSIRGFERNMVGPYDSSINYAEGGEALFIINQELRFPVFKWLEGVTFFDMGNVYETIEDFNPIKVRTALGLGLRINLPVIFLRFDYGFNLSPRPYEKRSVFYFSIGQAF